MKRKLLLVILGATLAVSAWAQSTDSSNAPSSNPPPPPPGSPPPGGPPHLDISKILTPDEQQELKTAHDAAMEANPDLETQEKALVEKMQEAHDSGRPPDPQLFAQMKELRQKIHAAMRKADPKIAPVLAKLDAAILHPPGGPPPRHQANSTSANNG